MDGPSPEAAPIACTLEGGDFKDRLAWIANLNRGALLGSRRDGLRLQLTYALHALKDVREMVRREQQCCAFLDFDLLVEDDAIRLVVTAPEEARAVAELVLEPFRSKEPVGSPASCGCDSGCAQ